MNAEPTSRTRHSQRLANSALIALLSLCFASCAALPQRNEREIRYEMPHKFAVSDPVFMRSMGELLGPALLPGNRVTALINGDEIFPAMLAAIRGAQTSVNFETYIYWSGDIGRQFSEAFCERARAGVKVHVLIDWLGSSKIDHKYLEEMKQCGVEVEEYHPLTWYNLRRLNNRTHRKLLIVDGKIGFTGGVGIADPWSGNGTLKDHWRDSHFKVEGPAVAQMQAVFGDNWLKTHSRVLVGDDYYPLLTPVGTTRAQVFKSSRDEGSESVRLMYLLSIASATKTIRLQAAYFVPDDLAINTLVDAARRGVKVEIMVPGPHVDSEIVQAASRSRWRQLLEAGVTIYQFQPCLFHCKVLIVDDLWVSVGSTNFDNRSFRLNDEANLNVYDAGFAAEQIRTFNADRTHCRLMTAEDFKERSGPQKILDSVAGVLRGQL
jgi:cardiolipin synthase